MKSIKLAIFIVFFLLSSTAVFFSALHAKHFEIWKNPLWNWWVDCFIAQSINWCDISEFSKWIHFPFHCVFFLKKTVFPLTLLSLVYHWVNQLRYLEYFFLNTIVNVNSFSDLKLLWVLPWNTATSKPQIRN